MSNKEKIIQELEQIPDNFLEDALNFILFLKSKVTIKRMETLIVSEPTLSKDWLRPEEEAAWQNL
jgi:hypothetical protein